LKNNRFGERRRATAMDFAMTNSVSYIPHQLDALADVQTEVQAGPLKPIPEGPCGYVSPDMRSCFDLALNPSLPFGTRTASSSIFRNTSCRNYEHVPRNCAFLRRKIPRSTSWLEDRRNGNLSI
jgi:hypothetical protein